MEASRRALIITGHEDPMWPFLRQACSPAELPHLVPFFTDLPNLYSCTYSPVSGQARFQLDGTELEDADIAAIWWRAIVPPAFEGSRAGLVEYCMKEYSAFYEGLEPLMPRALWVSKPSAIELARNKAQQLAIAKEIGFRVLDTVFTNSPKEARDRAAREETVFKSIRSPRIPVESGSYHTVFTTKLNEDTLKGAEGIFSCPGILQQFLDKTGDVRVTVIGDDVFGIFINSQASRTSSVDFRLGARSLEYRPLEIDRADADRCRVMLSKFGLRYGAF